jgi:hypothetical protein
VLPRRSGRGCGQAGGAGRSLQRHCFFVDVLHATVPRADDIDWTAQSLLDLVFHRAKLEQTRAGPCVDEHVHIGVRSSVTAHGGSEHANVAPSVCLDDAFDLIRSGSQLGERRRGSGRGLTLEGELETEMLSDGFQRLDRRVGMSTGEEPPDRWFAEPGATSDISLRFAPPAPRRLQLEFIQHFIQQTRRCWMARADTRRTKTPKY